MFVEIVRLFLVVLFTAAGFWIGRDLAPGAETIDGIAGMLGCLFGYVLGGLLGRSLARVVGVVERRIDRLPPPAVLAGLLGGAAGAVMGATLAAPAILLLDPRIALPLGGLVVWTIAYAGFRIAVHQSEALFAALGLSTRPLVRATPYAESDGFVIDTSAIMDGQLLALTRSGIFRADFLVPRFVLDELQGFSDARDDPRARRAQRGLEGLDALRRESIGRVLVLDDEVPEVREVDAKLIALARRLQVRILTTDANLARNAEVQGVPTVNLRRLAADLAPEIVAGQPLRVSLVKDGQQPGQGVGYLDDGSMVVVNEGTALVGAGECDFVATSVVPTAAGRIVFARTHSADAEARAISHAETTDPAATRQY
ncbi:MAG: PIN domain-containing protein [Acidimicrobiia bacterium]